MFQQFPASSLLLSCIILCVSALTVMLGPFKLEAVSGWKALYGGEGSLTKGSASGMRSSSFDLDQLSWTRRVVLQHTFLLLLVLRVPLNANMYQETPQEGTKWLQFWE